ncbi:MAG: lysophospholipase [Oscillospiraceae bacterium]|nr:lysophospholipase [Oscillospiraceae bacterium]
MTKKIISAVLMITLIAALPVAAHANEPADHTPVIIIPGYGGSHLYLHPESDNPQQIWPPVVDGAVVRSIAELLGQILPQLIADAGGNADEVVARLGELTPMLENIALGPNGLPLYPSGPRHGHAHDFRWDVMQQRGQTYQSNQRAIANNLGIPHSQIYKFANDWRLSHTQTAAHLHEFIAQVMEDSGHDRVNLIAVSHGGQQALTYLHLHGSQYLDRVILIAPAIRGSHVAVDLLESDHFVLSTNLFLRFIMTYIEHETIFIPHFHRVDTAQLSAIAMQLFRTYLQPLATHFGSFWDITAPEHYARLRDAKLDPDENADIIRRANIMHNEIMPQAGEILRNVQARGTRVAILAGTSLPIVGGNNINSDFVINVSSTTGALAREPGHAPFSGNSVHISPDGLIDASDAYLPMNTWFFCGQFHAQTAHDRYARMLTNYLLFSDAIDDVHSDPRFPQFRHSTTPIDGLSVRFAGMVCGFYDSDSDLLLVQNLSDFEVTLLSITAHGYELYVPLPGRITLRPGATVRLRFDAQIPTQRQPFNLDLAFIRELPVPTREMRNLAFTALPADEELPAPLRFAGEEIIAAPLRFAPVQALMILITLGGSLALAGIALGIIYKKRA